jgi:predicted DNA-binding protein
MAGQDTPGPGQSRHGVHNGVQTAFRLPADLKDWLESHAITTGRTMTDIVITALERERERASSRS